MKKAKLTQKSILVDHCLKKACASSFLINSRLHKTVRFSNSLLPQKNCKENSEISKFFQYVTFFSQSIVKIQKDSYFPDCNLIVKCDLLCFSAQDKFFGNRAFISFKSCSRNLNWIDGVFPKGIRKMDKTSEVLVLVRKEKMLSFFKELSNEKNSKIKKNSQRWRKRKENV